MVKVVVIGAAGGIGQPLALLMKLNPSVTELAVVDVAPVVAGVACDISHIPTKAVVSHAVGDPRPALAGAHLVLVPAGVPRKPGMTRDDLFNINAGIVKGVAEACADACPNAFFGIISNPVNSMVPVFAEVFRHKLGSVDYKKVFGVTTLDILRAKTFAGGLIGTDPTTIEIPVVGGHAGTTIVPLFSQIKPAHTFAPDVLEKLVKRTQEGGTEVVDAKAGAGSATLSMAQAAAVFAQHIIDAILGKSSQFCGYVGANPTYESEGVPYFASVLSVGVDGVTAIHPLDGITEGERAQIAAALPELRSSIKKGEDFVKEQIAKVAEAKN